MLKSRKMLLEYGLYSIGELHGLQLDPDAPCQRKDYRSLKRYDLTGKAVAGLAQGTF